MKPLFRRHFWLTAIIFVFILGLALSLSRVLTHIERTDFYKLHGEDIYRYVMSHPGDRIQFLRDRNHTEDQMGVPFTIELVRDGKSLLSGQTVMTATSDRSHASNYFERAMTDPPGAIFSVHFMPPGKGPAHHSFFFTFAIMVIAIVLATMLSIFILFYSFRERADLAKTVLTQMQKGDLKARFPVTFLDEAGQIMTLFNEMADEIERLVEQLRQNESYRVHLMQELTHDLRTPVSSLRNLIESLRFSGEKMSEKAKNEFVNLAFQETEYLTRLTEDLLFLALVFEPKYRREVSQVTLADLVSTQLKATASHYPNVQPKLENALPQGVGAMTGNEHQLKRLFRNALENAFSFAKSQVTVSLVEDSGALVAVIEDDGPGLSPAAVSAFGKKRSTRYQEPSHGGRISVGLGSVIIHVIAEAHGGHVNIQNRHDGQGARLEIRLKPE